MGGDGQVTLGSEVIKGSARKTRRLYTDQSSTLLISGTGDVIEHDEPVAGIGSGGSFAVAAATALMLHTKLDARHIAEAAMKIAANICIYTNDNLHFEELG